MSRRESILKRLRTKLHASQSIIGAGAGTGISVVAHMGLATKVTIRARTAKSPDQCVVETQAIRETATAIRKDILVHCHGGPIADPQDATYLFEKCPSLDGFYGASSMEKLPTENAIQNTFREFTQLRLHPTPT